jgi:hypothetical protein
LDEHRAHPVRDGEDDCLPLLVLNHLDRLDVGVVVALYTRLGGLGGIKLWFGVPPSWPQNKHGHHFLGHFFSRGFDSLNKAAHLIRFLFLCWCWSPSLSLACLCWYFPQSFVCLGGDRSRSFVLYCLSFQ